MEAPLSPAHRAWRTKVFLATWLSYVGFYFCRRGFSAAKGPMGDELGWSATQLSNVWATYLIAYAIGQFLASDLGTRLGPRKNVLIGMALSIGVTVVMGVTMSVEVMMGLVAVNGLAQASGWSGNVGTMASWFHKRERGRVMGLWSTNFITGAIVTGFFMSWILSMHDAGEPEPWRWCFFGGAVVLGVVWIQFYFLQRNRPEDVGLAAIDDPATAEDEAAPLTEAPKVGWRYLSRDGKINLILVSGFYFFVKLVRYAMWSWAAYFLYRNYGLSGSSANAYSTTFDVLGIPGVLLAGWMSDRFFASRRSETALILMIGMIVATGLLVAFGGSSVMVFALLLGAVGFTLYGPDSILSGAGAIDIGGRHGATWAAAVISGVGSLGPVVQELVIARLYDAKGGDVGPVFILLFGSASIAAAFCAALVWRNRRGGRGI